MRQAPPRLPDVGDQIACTTFPHLDLLLYGAAILAVWYLATESLFALVPGVMNAVPPVVWGHALPALGCALVLLGTRRIVTCASEADRTVQQEKYWLLFLPTGTRTEPFANVKYIDFHHPGDVDGDNSEMAFPAGRRPDYDGGTEIIAALAPYEIRIVLDDRTPLAVCRGYGHDRMLGLAMRLVRMTGTRLA